MRALGAGCNRNRAAFKAKQVNRREQIAHASKRGSRRSIPNNSNTRTFGFLVAPKYRRSPFEDLGWASEGQVRRVRRSRLPHLGTT